MFRSVKVCASIAFVVGAVMPAAQADEQYSVVKIVQIPAAPTACGKVGNVSVPCKPLISADIAWVDGDSHAYALADRSNSAIDVIDTRKNDKISFLRPDPPFAGASVANGGTAAAPNGAGPNGVIIIEGKDDVWAGDGPHCTGKTTDTCDKSGSLKVMDLKGKTKGVFYINPTPSAAHPDWPPVTAPATVHGRVDEICYNPASDVVLAGSNASGFGDSFISFVKEDTGEIEAVIRLDSSKFAAVDPDLGTAINANSGIEQCQYNPRDKKFYLAIPQLNKGPNGAVLRISGKAPFKVEKVIQITAAGCVQPAGGPAGLTIGPDHQILVGCNGSSTQSVIIYDDGRLPLYVKTANGVDEVWFDRGSNHYYLAQASSAIMGVEDAGHGKTLPSPDPDATTQAGNSRNPAADPQKNLVYLPVVAAPAGTGGICQTHGGLDAQGCIAIFSAPLDKDDKHRKKEASDRD